MAKKRRNGEVVLDSNEAKQFEEFKKRQERIAKQDELAKRKKELADSKPTNTKEEVERLYSSVAVLSVITFWHELLGVANGVAVAKEVDKVKRGENKGQVRGRNVHCVCDPSILESLVDFDEGVQSGTVTIPD